MDGRAYNKYLVSQFFSIFQFYPELWQQSVDFKKKILTYPAFFNLKRKESNINPFNGKWNPQWMHSSFDDGYIYMLN